MACIGTETGNPPTRNSDCKHIVCGPCVSPIVVRVTDSAARTAVTDVSINGDPSSCVQMPLYVECHLDGEPYTVPGVHSVELSAPGYAGLSLDVEVKASPSGRSCCSCGYAPTRVDVVLTPSSSSD